MAFVNRADYKVLVRFFGRGRVGRGVDASKTLRSFDFQYSDCVFTLDEVIYMGPGGVCRMDNSYEKFPLVVTHHL